MNELDKKCMKLSARVQELILRLLKADAGQVRRINIELEELLVESGKLRLEKANR